MRRFLGYYRQFEELSPEEVSRGFKQQRDEERAQALTETPALDLNTPAWHEPRQRPPARPRDRYLGWVGI